MHLLCSGFRHINTHHGFNGVYIFRTGRGLDVVRFRALGLLPAQGPEVAVRRTERDNKRVYTAPGSQLDTQSMQVSEPELGAVWKNVEKFRGMFDGGRMVRAMWEKRGRGE